MTHDQLKLCEEAAQQIITDTTFMLPVRVARADAIRALLSYHAKLEEECARLRAQVLRSEAACKSLCAAAVVEHTERGIKYICPPVFSDAVKLAAAALKAKEQP